MNTQLAEEVEPDIEWISEEASIAYEMLISSAGSPTKLEVYCERHHVIPRSFGGSDSASNLVYLTAPNHLLAHYWLWVGTGDPDLGYAYFAMANTNHSKYDETPLVTKDMQLAYERARKEFAKKLSDQRRGVPLTPEHAANIKANCVRGEDHPNWGGLSEETRKKISAWQTGRKLSESHRESIRMATLGKNNPFYGKTHSPEVLKVMSENAIRVHTGRKNTEETKKKMSISAKKIDRSTHKRHRKPVINIDTGVAWASVTECAKEHGTSGGHIRFWIRSSNFPFQYADDPKND